nr:tRNA 2-thiouridine(34) synthase MnmA [Glycomyces amatae]
MRVLAAMSGGVDSAVAAARAVEAGHDVTGVHLALSKNPQTYRTGARGCCTIEDSRDARRAADVIGIPFYVWDMAERFHEDVVEDFYAEYANGRTPNPCLRCNEKIKFAAVLDRAMALGFDAVATGHYARKGEDGLLRRAVDPGKDQSYVLAVLTPAQLAHSLFPLGDTPKDQVRAEAETRGLAVARKPDSHDICFIADGDTAGFLKNRLGAAQGEIVDAATGEVLGSHDGAHQFTVGQRHGLGLKRPAADGRPRYVLSITPVDNRVRVGPREALRVDRIRTGAPVWLAPERTGSFDAEVQLRAHGEVYPALVTADGHGLTARLRKPAFGVAAGQALVVYDPDAADGDAVLASGTIDEAGTVEAGTVETGTVETGTVETGTVETDTAETGPEAFGSAEATGVVTTGSDGSGPAVNGAAATGAGRSAAAVDRRTMSTPGSARV